MEGHLGMRGLLIEKGRGWGGGNQTKCSHLHMRLHLHLHLHRHLHRHRHTMHPSIWRLCQRVWCGRCGAVLARGRLSNGTPKPYLRNEARAHWRKDRRRTLGGMRVRDGHRIRTDDTALPTGRSPPTRYAIGMGWGVVFALICRGVVLRYPAQTDRQTWMKSIEW